MVALKRRVDDDELWDDELYDRAYYPKRVFKDGKGPRVPLMLTDSAPSRSLPWLADCAMSDSEAMAHRPHQAKLADGPARKDAERAYEARNRLLRDAYRSPPYVWDQDPAPDQDEPDPEDDPEAARKAYIQRLTSAYRAVSPRSPNAADELAAYQYRVSMVDPNATAESVAAERARYAQPPPRPPAPAGFQHAQGLDADHRAADDAWREMVERNAKAHRA